MERAETYYNSLIGKNNGQWIDSKYFKRTLKQGLKKDCDQLIAMINLCDDWNPQTDQKLNELEKLLSNTHKDDKIIIFTQYSDTAESAVILLISASSIKSSGNVFSSLTGNFSLLSMA